MGAKSSRYESVLLPESNGTVFCIHRIHDSQRLHMITQVADDTAADLESLFDNNAAAFHNRTGRLCNGNQALQCAAIGQDSIDDQNVLTLMQEFLGHDDLILILVGEGFHLGNEHITINVDRLGLLGKNQRNIKFLSNKGSNANAGRFNGHDLGNGLMAKSAFEFPTDFLHQSNIHLVVQKAIHLQHITGLYDAVFYDSLF